MEDIVQVIEDVIDDNVVEYVVDVIEDNVDVIEDNVIEEEGNEGVVPDIDCEDSKTVVRRSKSELTT